MNLHLCNTARKNHTIFKALILFAAFSSFASTSYAGGSRSKKVPDTENPKFAKSYNEKDLMPQPSEHFTFDVNSISEVRAEAMRRTREMMAAMGNRSAVIEDQKAQMIDASSQVSLQIGQFSQREVSQQSQQQSQQFDEQKDNSQFEDEATHRRKVQISAARGHFHQSELNYGHIDDNELLEDYWSEMLMQNIVNVFRERFPDKILKNPEWAFNEVGGTYARFLILYCHTNEYLGLWGLRVTNDGYSGSYKHVDFWDFIISGEITSHGVESPHSLRKHFLPPQDDRPVNETLSPFVRGNRKISYYAPNTYMIDYARGNILTALGDGAIKPFVYEAHDWRSLKVQLVSCAKSVASQMKQATKGCFGSCFGSNQEAQK